MTKVIILSNYREVVTGIYINTIHLLPM